MEETNKSISREKEEKINIPEELIEKSKSLTGHLGKTDNVKEPSKQLSGNVQCAESSISYQFAQDEHRYIREYISLADKKASFLFIAETGFLAYLNLKGITSLWHCNPLTWNGSHFLAFLATMGLFLGALLSIWVVMPRITNSKANLIFWGLIAKLSSGKDYSQQVIIKEYTELANLKLEHCYELAVVCSKKYSSLNKSMWFGAVGLISSVIILVFS